MKMELIQPFINAADAVLSQGLKSPMVIGNLSMEQEAYRRKGVAAVIQLSGDIEGRVIFDLTPKTAAQVASHFAGTELPETDDLVREARRGGLSTGRAASVVSDVGERLRAAATVLERREALDLVTLVTGNLDRLAVH